MGFNSAAIIKPKKFKDTDKVKSSSLKGVEEFMSKEIEEADELPESEDLKGTDKVKSSPFVGSNKANGETLMSIDLIMQGAKKPKANAYDKETGEFEVPTDSKGMFKESGESAKQKYLNKIKSRKGM